MSFLYKNTYLWLIILFERKYLTHNLTSYMGHFSLLHVIHVQGTYSGSDTPR